jgi:predicted membrane-bound mannosyltransferase
MIEPILHIWNWLWKIALAALAIVLTGVFVAFFTNVRRAAAIDSQSIREQVIDQMERIERGEGE